MEIKTNQLKVFRGVDGGAKLAIINPNNPEKVQLWDYQVEKRKTHNLYKVVGYKFNPFDKSYVTDGVINAVMEEQGRMLGVCNEIKHDDLYDEHGEKGVPSDHRTVYETVLNETPLLLDTKKLSIVNFRLHEIERNRRIAEKHKESKGDKANGI